MNQAQPSSRLTRFRIFWEALDSRAEAARPAAPQFEAARDWFECELEPEAVGEMLEAQRLSPTNS